MGASTQHTVNTIAILGANGQIGSFLYQHLRTKWPDITIKACVRSITCTNDSDNRDYFAFNPFTDNWQVLGKVDVLINCIGIIEENKHCKFEQAHVGLTSLILINRRIIGNTRVIQISALGADSSSPVPFLATKGKADNLLLTAENAVVVRPSIVCTPNTMLIQRLQFIQKMGKYFFYYLPLPAKVLQTRLQPIMPCDLATLIACLSFTRKHPDIIAAIGPEILTVREIIQLSIKNVTLIPASTWLFKLVPLILPRLINSQQLKLLLQHNTAEQSSIGSSVYTSTQSTKQFFGAAIPM
jgi:uncharacterized protein YbjT (DUF2867 family)